jgi:hypothetical protein
MDNRKVKNVCPKCGCLLLARENDEIICLDFNCSWREKSKRVSDKDIPHIQDLKEIFNG